MTAHGRYALLEAEAIYYDGITAQPHEVIIRFGETTLTLLSVQDEPLAHWALASLRAIDSTAVENDATHMTVAPGHDAEERLLLRDVPMIEALRSVCPDLDARPALAARNIGRAAAWLTLGVVSMAAIVFLIAPMAAERLAEALPQERAAAFGDSVLGIAARSVTGGPADICAAPEGSAALARLTDRLRRGAPDAPPLRVEVLRGDAVNAITVPGGRIAIFQGLLDRAATPEQLAGVLAHEIAHAEARDPLRETFRVVGVTGVIGLMVGDYAGGAVTAALAETVISGSYRRAAESRADDRALEILQGAGLPSGPLARMFDIFALSGRQPTGMLSHLATHPDLAGRADKARRADTIGDRAFEPALDDNDWLALKAICD